MELKSSKLSIETQAAVEQLIRYLQVNRDEIPYIWVEQAQMLAEFAGKESKPILLDILNSVIPLKEGMKLEGFSAKEFAEKYLYYRPSLLEQAEQEISQVDSGYKPTFNMINEKTHENSHIRELERAFKKLIGSSSCRPDNMMYMAENMYEVYEAAVSNPNKTIECIQGTNWDIALYLQNSYWTMLRGQTISIIRLLNEIRHPGDELYALPTPIDGMKKP